MYIPSRYIERVSGAIPIAFKLTTEGDILINKLKQYGVNFSIFIPTNKEIFFHAPNLTDLYENIHSDYYLIRHRLEILTERQLGDILWTISDNEVSNKDLEIHQNFLNENIYIGSEEEKRQRWQLMGNNNNLVIYYGLDFLLFKKLYWEIGTQKNDKDIIDFAIELYKENWFSLAGRYGIPYDASGYNVVTQLLIPIGIGIAAAFTGGAAAAWAMPYFTSYAVAGGIVTGAVVGAGTGAAIGSITPVGWESGALIGAGSGAIAGYYSTGSVTPSGDVVYYNPATDTHATESQLFASGGEFPPTYAPPMPPPTIPMIGAGAGADIGLLSTIGSTLTTAVSVAGTASKYLGGQKPPPLSGQQSQQPFDMSGILNSISNQNTQMLLLTLGGFIVFTLISD